jgi:hypothetical protein
VELNHSQKKVHAILALNLPNNVKELPQFLGMVQYYRDIWKKRSEKLAPLTNLVVSAERLRPPRKIKTKRNLGGGRQSINRHLTT